MGRILFQGSEFKAILSEEKIGFKTGLALTEERLRAIVDEIDPSLWPPSDDVAASIRSEAFARTVCRSPPSAWSGPSRDDGQSQMGG